MARPLRIQYEGAFYHVLNRGRNHEKIYLADFDYKTYLRTIEEACQLFNVQVLAYCLMSNHYHLLIHTPEANLSRFMRHVDGVYTQRFNNAHQKDGSLFKGRYTSILVEAEIYLQRLIRYIHLNPVKARTPEDAYRYPWSTHRAYLSGVDPGEWLRITLGLRFLAATRSEAIRTYKAMIEEGIDEEIKTFYSKRRLNPILGSASFVSRIKQEHIDTNQTIEVPHKRGIVGEKMIRRIFGVVSNSFRLRDHDELLERKRGESNVPRRFAITLARDLSGLTHDRISKCFHLGSARSVNKIQDRLAKEMNKDEILRKRYSRLKCLCR